MKYNGGPEEDEDEPYVDCHNFIKIMSKIIGRELMLRDNKRFHQLNVLVVITGRSQVLFYI
ncbi:hypothetical protein AALP_AA3G321500 [Arabis alpina]|uniref:DYW domain-containing protein n=1 Tax=Arabis alpina TaxID=50452 RepID=A0A087HD33_ARAAL|nr:hypothetical protein AALP_AA3G321500 [Arabis alpina]